MIIFKHSKDLKSHLKKIKANSVSVGFVPTMGALHAGHLSLMEKSKSETGVTVCSIYVNPVQFNNPDDYKNYPITLDADILLLEKSNCDILFLPDDKEIYPDEASKHQHFDLGYLETVLEGEYRPGHFQGVCMVVNKLLNIVEPTHLFLGQKDFQQSLVIKKLAGYKHKKLKIIIVPTLREQGGLAMSSRNMRLNDEEKKMATNLYKTLSHIKDEFHQANFHDLKKKAVSRLKRLGFIIDYLEMAKAANLEIIDEAPKSKGIILLIAAYLNNVRLIDNLIITK
ncbi:MAG: pantoate--beta-alanine ligase [Ginsengibacter sp.]